MRSRTLREGIVGLFILASVGLLGFLIFWLRGVNLGKQNFEIKAKFQNVAGMKLGAAVRYRGVTVGKIVDLHIATLDETNGTDLSAQPAADYTQVVAVTLRIQPSDLRIPKDAVVEANQVGLISETLIDIVPQDNLPQDASIAPPLSENCPQQNMIICDGDWVKGRIGVSYDSLIRSVETLSTRLEEISQRLIEDENFLQDIKRVVANTADATGELARLGREVSTLTSSVRNEVGQVSDAAVASTNSIRRLSEDIRITANRLNTTTQEVNQLVENVNSLVTNNQETVVATLENLNRVSSNLQSTVERLQPLTEEVGSQAFVQNLTQLSENAAIASEQLRQASETLADPANLTMLQQTLDSARAAFDNAAKLTSDLDELMGDPEFRNNLRDLVEGLNQLVSSTETLEQQTQLAQDLQPISQTLRQYEDRAAKVPPAEKSIKLPPWIEQPANQSERSTYTNNL
ncbi:MlaD family protein [Geitlerinema sp. PCC 9228]|uniref:MlaD family protein n=1 Tax=Geitlerinema sp. PCC 9228 TaxID=111611 RepID=UPI0008F9DB8F|nr:MlaD family protein [Geitlerinema sp. PCC 9228]